MKQLKLRIWFFILAFVGMGLQGYATTYYVATTGNDNNPGTTDFPFATINKGAAVAQAGDVVIIRSGTYRPAEKIMPANSGTEVAPITFRAEEQGGAIIDGQFAIPSADLREGLFHVLSKNWIVIDGLRIINSGFFGFLIKTSSNVTVKNCSTRMTYASGICGANSSNVKALNNSVELACMYPSTAMNTSECITMASVNGFEVAYNTVFNRPTDPSNGGEGIDAKNACLNGSIHHNTVYDLFRMGIYIDAYGMDLSNVEVYANTVYNCYAGIYVASEEGAIVTNVQVHDNVIRDCTRNGIRLCAYLRNGPLKDIYIYQNTVVRCGSLGNWLDSGIFIESDNTSCTNFVVRNNIVSQNKMGIRMNGQTFPITIDNNLIDGPTYVTGTNPITGSPSFVNAAGNNFRLQQGSPAIDKAAGSPSSTTDFDDFVRPYDGDGIPGAISDLGAFEYHGIPTQKMDQTITFNAIPIKYDGDPDFNPGATASSGLAVSYTSSNTSVATIISNMVHIVGVGTSTITASQAGDAYYNPAPNVSKVLTVSPVFNTVTLEAENATLQGAVVSSANSGYTGTGYADYINLSGDYVQWSVNNVNVAGQYTLTFRYALKTRTLNLKIDVNGTTVNSGLSFPTTRSWTKWQTVSITTTLNLGTNIIRASAIGAGGPNMDNVTVEMIRSSSMAEASALKSAVVSDVNLIEQQADADIIVYPNPATDLIKVKVPASAGEKVSVYISDLNGRMLIMKTLTASQDGITELGLDVQSISQGSYILNVTTEKFSKATRILVQ